MTKTLTIEVPDNLQERLGIPASAADGSLETVILQTLQTLAHSIQCLQDPTPAVRIKATQTLSLLGSETVIPALTDRLRDENLSVRQAAIEALQQMGTESALEALAHARPTAPPTLIVDPIVALIGTLHLGTTDLAENHDRYLTADLERELTPGE